MPKQSGALHCGLQPGANSSWTKLKQQSSKRTIEVTQRAVLDDAWQKKIARARAELSVRKYKEEQAKAKSGKVKRTSYDFSKREDVVAFNIKWVASLTATQSATQPDIF